MLLLGRETNDKITIINIIIRHYPLRKKKINKFIYFFFLNNLIFVYIKKMFDSYNLNINNNLEYLHDN